MEIAPELAAVPNALDMTALQGVAGIVVIGRNIRSGGVADNPRPGKADPA